jgi:hypothetical protein
MAPQKYLSESIERSDGAEMSAAENVTGLVDEYRTLFDGLASSDSKSLQHVLTHDAEWTPEAASQLLKIARAYGSFMLRNALAISLVLGVEDG